MSVHKRIKQHFGRFGFFWYMLGWTVLKITGWRAVGEERIPDAPRIVGVYAPHTSGMDVFFMLAYSCVTRRKANFLVKSEANRGILGRMLALFGAVFIERRGKLGFVRQAADAMRQSGHMYLLISPEGTRKKVDYWRTGFYYIALEAGAPMALTYADYAKKEVGVGLILYPTGDIEADMAKIRAFYANVTPRYPERTGPVHVKSEAQSGTAGDVA
ncbi:MAG: 1-acyl-sn-glycerol-3-phosphate acyltransferase [Candidatus Hydrogenedentota bacterium]